MRLPTLHSQEELIALVNEIGFLPAFRNDIPGFSVEECIAPEYWFPKEGEGFWEWKGPVIQKSGCAYGKFFKGRAGFITLPWYCEFANYRRDGYDFDARWEDGLARGKDKTVFDVLWEHQSLLSKQLKEKTAAKGFEEVITHLQMLGYVVIADFEYMKTRAGVPYGWGVARYETPEYRFGEKFTDSVYRHTPEESKELLSEHLKKILPDVNEMSIYKFLG